MKRIILLCSAFLLAATFGACSRETSSEPQPLAPPEGAAEGGAYFCCDAVGENCVYSPNGDCDSKLKWCAKTGNDNDGTVICTSWE